MLFLQIHTLGCDEWQCNNGYCFREYQLCDVYDDCGDWSDELHEECYFRGKCLFVCIASFTRWSGIRSYARSGGFTNHNSDHVNKFPPKIFSFIVSIFFFCPLYPYSLIRRSQYILPCVKDNCFLIVVGRARQRVEENRKLQAEVTSFVQLAPNHTPVRDELTASRPV